MSPIGSHTPTTIRFSEVFVLACSMFFLFYVIYDFFELP